MLKILRRWFRNIIGLSDSPHKIALGLALGIFVGFLPIMGIQMAAVLPFALLFRSNKTAAIAGVWITNPVTVIPIYYMNYRAGLVLSDYTPLTRTDFTNLFHHLSWREFVHLGAEILCPLLLGSVAVAVSASIPTYFITRFIVTHNHRRRAALPPPDPPPADDA